MSDVQIFAAGLLVGGLGSWVVVWAAMRLAFPGRASGTVSRASRRLFWGVSSVRLWFYVVATDFSRWLAPDWTGHMALPKGSAQKFMDRWEWVHEQESRERLAFEAVAAARGDLR